MARHPGVLRTVAVIAVIALLAYLIIRLIATREGANPVSFTLLFMAEVFSLVTYGLHLFGSWSIRRPENPAPLEVPTDIVIATYDEALPVLEPTIVASLRVRGVGNVWVLDDGRRPEVARLCETLGANYLTRSDRDHAKAGNINAALPHLTADLLLLLDADHVPRRNAIEAMSGYFRDPRVAIVQSPHDFRNRDSAQHAGYDHHEQSLFFEVLLPARERDQAAFWCGSAALIRRSALVEVGGVATETVAEDLHTTLKMQQRGYLVRIHDEILVTGLAPHTTSDYLLQRDRWARGTLAALFSPESPIFGRGWRWRQRLHYLNNLLYYLIPLQRLAFATVLLLILLFGWLPVGEASPSLIVMIFATVALTMLGSLSLARGRHDAGEGNANAWISAEIHLRALGAGLLRRRSSFRVTPKTIAELPLPERLRLLRLPIAVTLALIVAWLLRALGLAAGQLTPLAFWASTAFVALELVTVVPMLIRELTRRQNRGLWRFATRQAGTLSGVPVSIVDLHEGGARVIGRGGIAEVGTQVPLVIEGERDGRSVRINGTLTVQRVAPDGGRFAYGGTLTWDTDEDRWNLIDLCYVTLAAGDGARIERTLA